MLDIRTLVFTLLAFTLVFSIGLFMLQRSQPRVRGLYWWSAANAVGCVAFLMMVLRGMIPDFWSIVVANSLFIVALSFFHEGVVRLRGKIWACAWLLPLTLMVVIPSLIYYTYVQENTSARIVVMMLASLIYAAMAMRLLVKDIQPRVRLAYWFTSTAFAQMAVICLVRMVHAIVYPPSNFMEAGPMQAALFLGVFLLSVISSFGCVWIVTAHLADELERQARTDPLTGAMNRLALDESLERELELARRTGTPLSVLIFDLDHFKRLNDKLGHQHGDAALKLVADLTHRELRAADFLARYGGEEFLVVLPNTDKAAAIDIANRLRGQLERLAISRGDGTILTSSYGISSYPEDGEEADQLIGNADVMLYDAKQAGRNSVVASRSAEWQPTVLDIHARLSDVHH